MSTRACKHILVVTQNKIIYLIFIIVLCSMSLFKANQRGKQDVKRRGCIVLWLSWHGNKKGYIQQVDHVAASRQAKPIVFDIWSWKWTKTGKYSVVSCSVRCTWMHILKLSEREEGNYISHSSESLGWGSCAAQMQKSPHPKKHIDIDRLLAEHKNNCLRP